eukprot:11095492-Karenia_brevis.AAC.1
MAKIATPDFRLPTSRVPTSDSGNSQNPDSRLPYDGPGLWVQQARPTIQGSYGGALTLMDVSL